MRSIGKRRHKASRPPRSLMCVLHEGSREVLETERDGERFRRSGKRLKEILGEIFKVRSKEGLRQYEREMMGRSLGKKFLLL